MLLFLTKAIIHLQASKPAINAAKKPIIIGVISDEILLISPLDMSLITLPTIKGTTIKNKNLAAFVLSIPNKTAVEIVAQEDRKSVV